MTVYNYSGSAGAYVVPAGVTAVTAECYGAAGGGGGGGKGGYVKAVLPVTPGETLYPFVGGQGLWNGGGPGTVQNGGDMSDVRRGGTATSNIVVIAGGGGGDGGTAHGGGAGGNPGAAGGNGGGGGTQSAGGAGSGSGSVGTAWAGGIGATGGGGGHFGGGGSSVGGGGGGCSWAEATAVGVVYLSGVQSGNGQIIITPYVPPAPTLTGPANGSYVDVSGGSVTLAGTYTADFGASQSGWQARLKIPTTANVASPTYSATTAVDSGATYPVNFLIGATVTAGASTMVVTANTATTLTGASWTGGTPSAGTAFTITNSPYLYWTGSSWYSSSPITTAGASLSNATTGWSNGNTFNWSLATVDTYGVSAFAADWTLTAAAAPTVSVTAPTGTATLNPAATVAWTPTPATGLAEIAARVIIYTAAQYGAGGFAPGVGASAWDSGQLYGAPITATSPPLPNATYRAYAQVTQTGGQVSPWAYSGFVINVTPPGTPTLTATLDTANARTTLSLSSLTNGDTASVQSSDDSGVTWQAVRNATLVPSTGTTLTLYDYEAPPLGTREYRAEQVTTAYFVPSAWSSTSSLLTTTSSWRLMDPLNPSGGLAIIVLAVNFQQREQSAAHYGIAEPGVINFPTIVSSGFGGHDGTATIQTFTAADYATLGVLLTSGRTLWLSSPFGDALYVRIGPMPGGMSAGSGNIVRNATLLGSVAANPTRTLTISWVEQSAP